MSKTDKIIDAQQTSEDRELTDAELDSVNGATILQYAAGVVITTVAEAIYLPLVRAGLLHPGS